APTVDPQEAAAAAAAAAAEAATKIEPAARGEVELDLNDNAALSLDTPTTVALAQNNPAAAATPAAENNPAGPAPASAAASSPDASNPTTTESNPPKSSSLLDHATRCMRKFLFFISSKDKSGSVAEDQTTITDNDAPKIKFDTSADSSAAANPPTAEPEETNENTKIINSTKQSTIEIIANDTKEVHLETESLPSPGNTTLLNKLTGIFKNKSDNAGDEDGSKKSILDGGPILGHGKRKEKTSLLSRLIPGHKVNDALVNPKTTKKNNNVVVIERPGCEVRILPRIYILLVDFIICFNFITCVLPHTTLQTSVDQLMAPVLRAVDEKNIAKTWGIVAPGLKKISFAEPVIKPLDQFLQKPPKKFIQWAQNI
ncbi:MAG: hypothetical protein J6Y94_07715, partial [Bacteriovoracaceae bacterium]|nr:hypothetical protein [Bacteriovoracaceae bacterium]